MNNYEDSPSIASALKFVVLKVDNQGQFRNNIEPLFHKCSCIYPTITLHSGRNYVFYLILDPFTQYFSHSQTPVSVSYL